MTLVNLRSLYLYGMNMQQMKFVDAFIWELKINIWDQFQIRSTAQLDEINTKCTSKNKVYEQFFRSIRGTSYRDISCIRNEDCQLLPWRVGGLNPTVDKIFCNVHLFRVPRS